MQRCEIALVFLTVTLHLCSAIDPAIIIHGGAGSISGNHAEQEKVGMIDSIRAGFGVLLETDNPLDAVEAAIKVMENSPAFNAGYGSVLNENGDVEMDAIIVNGTDLRTGAVGALKHVRNPVSVARFVMNSTKHVLVVGQSAEKFAEKCGMELVASSELIANFKGKNKRGLVRKERSVYQGVGVGTGTVGAVAINSKGNIAAATSTGGLWGKLEGRVGDSPIIGAGTLADDEIAGISGTGCGEAFIKYRVASRVASLIERGTNASDAIITVLNRMTRKIPGSLGGAIVITKDGEIGVNWNSEQLAWAYVKQSEMSIHFGVNRGEDFSVNF